jgi:hypothetical protein
VAKGAAKGTGSLPHTGFLCQAFFFPKESGGFFVLLGPQRLVSRYFLYPFLDMSSLF